MKCGNVYIVPYEEYFANFDPLYIEYRQKSTKAINQLVERYNIKRKSLLSVGASLGNEEYWFYKNGCSLNFVDIDEHQIIEKYLTNLPECNEGLVFHR